MEICQKPSGRSFDVTVVTPLNPEFKPGGMARRRMNGATVRIETSRRREVLSWSQAPAPPPWKSIGKIASLVVSRKLPDELIEAGHG
ncbi:MAG: hypothetical protein IIA72_03205 [Proteobacteria bacterium]|nr:hypothetical protein [Pseudomonadota bacterium]